MIYIIHSHVSVLTYDIHYIYTLMDWCSQMIYILHFNVLKNAHFGKRREMLPYVAFIEYPCPAYKNPSDYYRKFKKMAKNLLIIII